MMASKSVRLLLCLDERKKPVTFTGTLADLKDLASSAFADVSLDGSVLQIWSAEFECWIDLESTEDIVDKTHIQITRVRSTPLSGGHVWDQV